MVSYFDALKLWNKEFNKGSYKSPKKGTEEYRQVRSLYEKMKAGGVEKKTQSKELKESKKKPNVIMVNPEVAKPAVTMDVIPEAKKNRKVKVSKAMPEIIPDVAPVMEKKLSKAEQKKLDTKRGRMNKLIKDFQKVLYDFDEAENEQTRIIQTQDLDAVPVQLNKKITKLSKDKKKLEEKIDKLRQEIGIDTSLYRLVREGYVKPLKKPIVEIKEKVEEVEDPFAIKIGPSADVIAKAKERKQQYEQKLKEQKVEKVKPYVRPVLKKSKAVSSTVRKPKIEQGLKETPAKSSDSEILEKIKKIVCDKEKKRSARQMAREKAESLEKSIRSIAKSK